MFTGKKHLTTAA